MAQYYSISDIFDEFKTDIDLLLISDISYINKKKLILLKLIFSSFMPLNKLFYEHPKPFIPKVF